jgi:bifunctional non-homologous end joining protein LigD
MGVFEPDGLLRYAGRAQPYLQTSQSAAFLKQARGLDQPDSPFAKAPRRASGRDYYWLKPEMVCEVSFLEWTKNGEIRHPVFKALRNDKAARESRRRYLLMLTPGR